MSRHSSLKFLQLFGIFGLVLAFNSENVINEDVYTKIDLQNQLVYVKNVIVFHNVGLEVLESYIFVISEPELHYITFFNRLIEVLKHRKLESDSEWTYYEVFLDKSVLPNQTFKMFAQITYANKISPLYKQRKIEQDQVMKFEGNLHFFSPYKTLSFKSEYIVKNNSLIAISEKPTQIGDTKVAYQLKDIEKYSKWHFDLIFVNNEPFLVITDLHRIIDVNHFGKIFIQDRVHLENNGAKLVGPYNDDLDPMKIASTKWLYTHLPASAEDIKFFDGLGNSSKTRIYHFFEYITLKFKARHPLLGGWKTYYYLQYAVPAHEYLFSSENYYVLKIRAVDYVLDGKLIENSVINIVLPEGAEIRNVYLPEGFTLSDEKITYLGGLCVFGRPTVVLNGTHLFEHHIANVEIEYFFYSLYLFRAPFVISCYVQAIFLLVLVGKYFF